jgi:hypothetical protein
MTPEQARQIFKKIGSKIDCNNCPYNWADPQVHCNMEQCMEQHFVIGCLEGYNKALEDLKAPKTLAENRED